MKLVLHKLTTPTINILEVLHQWSYKILFTSSSVKRRRMEKLNEYLPSMKLDLIYS